MTEIKPHIRRVKVFFLKKREERRKTLVVRIKGLDIRKEPETVSVEMTSIKQVFLVETDYT